MPSLTKRRARPHVNPAFLSPLPLRVHIHVHIRPLSPLHPSRPPCQTPCSRRLRASVSETLRENLSTVSEPVLRAVETLSRRQPRQTVADIAAQAAVPLSDASSQAVLLASLVAAPIDVTDDGQIAYRFPSDVRSLLRSRSLRASLSQLFLRVAPTLFLVARVLFGALLFISIIVTFVAIAALSSASRSEDDRRDSRSSSFFAPRFFGPDIFDVVFYSRYYAPNRTRSPDDMSFLEAVYSFVFGDGDPNVQFDQRRWRAVASLIRANRGAVTAEQLAPLLDPTSSSPDPSSNLVDESFVLPALVRFQGRPEVTDDGDIIYVFPSFTTTGASTPTVELLGSRGNAPVQEQLQSLTNASPSQRVMVVALGIVNVLGVAILGSKLLTVVPITRDAAQLVSLVRSIYPALFAYATSFFAVPLLRWFRMKSTNAQIQQRNDARVVASRVVANAGPEVRRKIRAAEQYVVRGTSINADNVVYSSDRDIIDQPSIQEELTEDFDRRLKNQ